MISIIDRILKSEYSTNMKNKLERLKSTMHGGIRRGELVILCSRSGTGRSTFYPNGVEPNIAIDRIPVINFEKANS